MLACTRGSTGETIKGKLQREYLGPTTGDGVSTHVQRRENLVESLWLAANAQFVAALVLPFFQEVGITSLLRLGLS